MLIVFIDHRPVRDRNGKLVVTGSRDRSLKVWNAHTGYLTQVPPLPHRKAWTQV